MARKQAKAVMKTRTAARLRKGVALVGIAVTASLLLPAVSGLSQTEFPAHSAEFRKAEALGPESPDTLDSADSTTVALQRARAAYAKHEQLTQRTATELRGRNDLAAKELDGLRKLVEKSFELRQTLHGLELSDLETRLRTTRQRLEHRQQNAEDIIERRVAELLDPELFWEPAIERSSRQPSPAGGEQSTGPLAERVERQFEQRQARIRRLDGDWVLKRTLGNENLRITIEGNRWTLIHTDGSTRSGQVQLRPRPATPVAGLSLVFLSNLKVATQWMGEYEFTGETLALHFKSFQGPSASQSEMMDELWRWSGAYVRVEPNQELSEEQQRSGPEPLGPTVPLDMAAARRQVSALLQREQKLLSRYGPSHPEVAKLRQELALARRPLEADYELRIKLLQLDLEAARLRLQAAQQQAAAPTESTEAGRVAAAGRESEVSQSALEVRRGANTARRDAGRKETRLGRKAAPGGLARIRSAMNQAAPPAGTPGSPVDRNEGVC